MNHRMFTSSACIAAKSLREGPAFYVKEESMSTSVKLLGTYSMFDFSLIYNYIKILLSQYFMKRLAY